MKRLFASLSLPIGIIFFVILAFFSVDKEPEIRRKERARLQPKKEMKKNPQFTRGEVENKKYLLKPYFTTDKTQHFLKEDSLVHPDRIAQ